MFEIVRNGKRIESIVAKSKVTIGSFEQKVNFKAVRLLNEQFIDTVTYFDESSEIRYMRVAFVNFPYRNTAIIYDIICCIVILASFMSVKNKFKHMYLNFSI